MIYLEVRDADGAGAAVVVELLHRLPGGYEVAVVEHRQWPVDQEQVHVVEAELGERLVEGPSRVVGLVERVVELAGYEDVAAVEARGADALAYLLLVAVHLRRVDVPVADPQGLAHSLRSIARFDLEDPEAELRDRVSIVQGDIRYRAQSRTTPSCVVNYLPNREPHENTPNFSPPNSDSRVRKGQSLLINCFVPFAGA